jgi:N-glycosylase/DNA lyase
LTPRPFDWNLAVRGHGWYQLAPFEWDAESQSLHFAMTHDSDVLEVRIQHDGEAILASIESHAALPRASVLRIRSRIQRMFRLDEDLTPFWRVCAKTPRMRWVAKIGAGRILRSPTIFEDQLKILFTTNCTWTNTQNMSRAVVLALGKPSPTGRRAFPTASACARKPPDWWREHVRVGYRVPGCVDLSRRAKRDDVLLDPSAHTDTRGDVGVLRRVLQERPGFGPYAAGQALRLLGRYDDLALDAAVRSHLGRGRSDAALRSDYAPFDAFAGLALWMDFSRYWLDHPKIPPPAARSEK